MHAIIANIRLKKGGEREGICYSRESAPKGSWWRKTLHPTLKPIGQIVEDTLTESYLRVIPNGQMVVETVTAGSYPQGSVVKGRWADLGGRGRAGLRAPALRGLQEGAATRQGCGLHHVMHKGAATCQGCGLHHVMQEGALAQEDLDFTA